MTRGPGTGGRPGYGRNNPRPGQRGTKATAAVSGRGSGRGTPHRGSSKPPKKGSGGSAKSILIIAVGLLAVPVAAILSVAGFLIHGWVA